MNKNWRVKEKLSVSTVGKQMFWSGIGIGLLSTVLLSLFFNYGRELMRYLFSMYYNLVDIPPERNLAYSLFYAALSASLASNLMLWVWAQGLSKSAKRRRLHLRMASTYSFFVLWMILEVFVNFNFATSFGIYGHWGERALPFTTGIQSSIFYLLPLMVFLHGWHSLRLYARSQRWMFYNFAAVLVLALLLSRLTLPNQQMVENAYAQLYQPEYHFLDSMIQKAELAYDLKFTEADKTVLRQSSTLSALEQLAQIKETFAASDPVSLREIIMLRISVHNLRPRDSFYGYGDDQPYPHPETLFRQLGYFPSTSAEAKEIVLTINEMVSLYNVRLNYNHTPAQREIRQYNFQNNLFRDKAIAESLKSVVRKINTNKQWVDQYGTLPMPDNKRMRFWRLV